MVCFHKKQKGVHITTACEQPPCTWRRILTDCHPGCSTKTNRIILTTISFEKSDGVIAAELAKRRYCSALKENFSLTMLLPPPAFK